MSKSLYDFSISMSNGQSENLRSCDPYPTSVHRIRTNTISHLRHCRLYAVTNVMCRKLGLC